MYKMAVLMLVTLGIPTLARCNKPVSNQTISTVSGKAIDDKPEAILQ